jgi:hypothetical protein
MAERAEDGRTEDERVEDERVKKRVNERGAWGRELTAEGLTKKIFCLPNLALIGSFSEAGNQSFPLLAPPTAAVTAALYAGRTIQSGAHSPSAVTDLRR